MKPKLPEEMKKFKTGIRLPVHLKNKFKGEKLSRIIEKALKEYLDAPYAPPTPKTVSIKYSIDREIYRNILEIAKGFDVHASDIIIHLLEKIDINSPG